MSFLFSSSQLSILKVIGVLNPDHTNLIRFYEKFDYLGNPCLVFEMLDMNIYELLQERDWKPLPVREIRPLAHQVCV